MKVSLASEPELRMIELFQLGFDPGFLRRGKYWDFGNLWQYTMDLVKGLLVALELLRQGWLSQGSVELRGKALLFSSER